MANGPFYLLGILLMGVGVLGAQNDQFIKREQMVKTQLQARGISDPLTLYSMLNVPRHEFVPKSLVDHAYKDGALPIGNDQTISQPYIVAFMTQTLQLKSTDKVLEIGTGSGYQAAVLGKIVDSVFTIEIIKDLAMSAKGRLANLGFDNVSVKWGDGYHGWPEKAPFDAIMVTAGAESVPKPLVDQLKNGGHMVIPVGQNNDVTYLVKVTKRKDRIITKKLFPVRFVPFTRNN
ncbi:protein-L-isoaspartate(D-aspartate) O-methyltransferase [Arenibacter sp. N53]|uniref:protein-L-isoaspartate(D-aspartate) O-methyltransferase n=1 Tax=Arenibacter TaxID=178469 RepID=UPI000CD47C1A|nr:MULTISPECIES: protein-L-isoaspartate(D-aspartate) O-methyltransferase [Arenibacter]MCM4152374.1 protein-L-isoaspartate(D-aspartate) O-methyltransferase [Arenibacter sp. N53]